MLSKVMFVFLAGTLTRSGEIQRTNCSDNFKDSLLDLVTELSGGGGSCRMLPVRPGVPRSEGLHSLRISGKTTCEPCFGF